MTKFEKIEVLATRKDYSEVEKEYIIIDDYDMQSELAQNGIDINDVEKITLANYNAQYFNYCNGKKLFSKKWVQNWHDIKELTFFEDGSKDNQLHFEFKFDILLKNGETDQITIDRYTSFSY